MGLLALATLGRALAVGPHGPVPPCPSEHHAKSERTRSPVLARLRRKSTSTRGLRQEAVEKAQFWYKKATAAAGAVKKAHCKWPPARCKTTTGTRTAKGL
jgi:hypothetical protein